MSAPSSPPVPVNRTLLIWILAGLTMLGAFSIDAYLPSFPAIASDFQVEGEIVQQTLTIYLAAFAVMTLFHGALSDSIGRRPVILAGLTIYLAGSIGAYFATSIPQLLTGRFFQGLSAGAGLVVGRAMVRDLFPGAEGQKVLAYIMVVFGIAPVIAPIVGGFLEVHFGWHSVFIFLVGYGSLLLTACALRLPESLPPERRAPLHLGATLREYLRVASDARFMMQCMAISTSSAILYLYVTAAPAYVIGILHLRNTQFAWLFVPLVAGIMGGSFISGKFAHRWAPERIVVYGFLIMAISALGNLAYTSYFTPTIPVAVLIIMVGTFGMALASPAMTLLTLDLYPTRRGLASSVQSFFVMGGFAACSGFMAPLLFDSAFKLACGAAGCVAIGAFCWLFAKAVPRRPESIHLTPEEVESDNPIL